MNISIIGGVIIDEYGSPIADGGTNGIHLSITK